MASTIPGRSATSCKMCWRETQRRLFRGRKGIWSHAEDAELASLVERLGTVHWQEVASHLASAFIFSQPKTARQCRDRWLNSVNPDIKRYCTKTKDSDRTDATLAELVLLCEEWLKVGNRWSQIARLLGRSEYWVKKHWRMLLKSERLVPDEPERIRGYVVRLASKLRGLATEKKRDWNEAGEQVKLLAQDTRGSLNPVPSGPESSNQDSEKQNGLASSPCLQGLVQRDQGRRRVAGRSAEDIERLEEFD